MKSGSFLARVGVALCAALPLLTLAVAAEAIPTVEQTIVLRPGWNAVFLEVTPEPADLETVFGGQPVDSVWYWSPGAGRAQFIRDPGELLPDQPGWRVWFPPGAGEKAVLSNLHAVSANNCYLIQVAGDRDLALTLSGRPSLRRPPWQADSFNLAGFTIDRAAPPSYASFFAHSKAHSGQAIYRLVNGSWVIVDNPAASMRPGEAFWVYTEGYSEYAGPLSVSLDYGDDLDFGRGAAERTVKIRNHAGSDRSISFGIDSAAPVPLSRMKVAGDGRPSWPDLAGEPSLTVHGGTEEMVRLAVRRADMSAASAGAVLRVTDGQGSLVQIPLAAAVTLGALNEPDHAGLWVGTVTVNAVTEAQIPARAEFTVPQPAGFWFTFKIIVHVDGGGRARLLKEVIQMMSPAGGADPPQPVLLTDDTLIPLFEPVTMVGGEPFSHRISTAAYDFAGQYLDMSGSFSATGTLNCTINVPADLPTNPFLHAYHPDHNNLDELDNPITNPAIMEVYAVTRALTLRFSDSNPECGTPDCATPPDWGYTRMGGSYEETLSGLHRNAIKVSGFYTLQRVTDIASLNHEEVAP